ncbi:phenylacetate--CoA ligase family protein [Cellvibrio mixtus]|uniref:phenylacetate--CoA ligase family protein n=1 Tax=Cellvibrio mixtus TaxID=39650 RepID=UPI0005870061|nr:phenylacetate--CoA ligase family protein [Cellvibrio mixtus]
MNPVVESLYYKSPVFLQNLAVSLMGLRLRAERYRPAGEEKLKELLISSQFTAEQMCAYQSEQFVQLARHAIYNTEFYRRWAKEQGISVSDIRSLADIKQFPVIEKNFIRENAALFKAGPRNVTAKPMTLFTSGTTGTPLSVFTDQDSRSEHYAFFSRLRSWYGVDPVARRATLFGRIIMPAVQKKPPFWRYDAAQKNLLMSSYHLKPENVIHYYNKLRTYQPQEIFSYPSSITRIAEFIVAEKLPPLPLKLLMTTAENLHEWQKTLLQQAFDAPIVNQYGCTEMAFFVSSLPDGSMRFHPEHGIAEVRTPSGEIAEQGEGELVVTGLVNYSMPVIRYAIGDTVTIGSANANGFPELVQVHGRKDDVIYMCDGTPVGRLDPIFKGGSGIRAAQILQDQSGAISLRLVPDETYTEQAGIDLRRELIKRVGDDLPIEIALVNEIAKEKNGKFKPVISNFKKGQ